MHQLRDSPMVCVYSEDERQTEIDRERERFSIPLSYQGVLGPLPLSFPSLSAHVWQTVGKRQKQTERES